MKAAVIPAPNEIITQDVPIPHPNPWEALVKIDACALCNGTDTKILHGSFPGTSNYPIVPGHESTGIVLEIGAAVRRYKLGDRVLRPAADPPGMRSMWGGFAEFGLVGDPEAFHEANPGSPPDWRWAMQQVVPPEIPAEEASILITLKETYSWLMRFDVGPDNRVLILGAGPVGLAFAHWAKFLGSPVVAVAARRADALERAMSFGANARIDLKVEDIVAQAMEITSGQGFDRIVDSVGSSDLLKRCMPLLSPGGHIGIYGIADATCQDFGEIRVPRSGDYTLRCFGPDEPVVHQDVVNFALSGTIWPAKFITHRLPLDEIRTAFDLVADRKAVKVVITI